MDPAWNTLTILGMLSLQMGMAYTIYCVMFQIMAPLTRPPCFLGLQEAEKYDWCSESHSNNSVLIQCSNLVWGQSLGSAVLLPPVLPTSTLTITFTAPLKFVTPLDKSWLIHAKKSTEKHTFNDKYPKCFTYWLYHVVQH